MNEIKFSEILKERLKGENLSKLSKELGIGTTILHEWTQAKRLPSMKNMHAVKKLADYLDLSLDEILFGTKAKETNMLTSLSFKDGDKTYKVTISKI